LNGLPRGTVIGMIIASSVSENQIGFKLTYLANDAMADVYGRKQLAVRKTKRLIHCANDLRRGNGFLLTRNNQFISTMAKMSCPAVSYRYEFHAAAKLSVNAGQTPCVKFSIVRMSADN
jgi:hypothetical protein